MRQKMTLDQIKTMFDLSGKVAVVTGGSGGFGKAAAIGLAAYGADVAITSRKLPGLEEAAHEVEALGKKALPVSCDVAEEDSVAKMAETVVKELGKIDIMVTSAGIADREAAHDMPIDRWQKVMDVNVRGTFLCAQAAARDMIKREAKGSIVTVGSVRGHLGHPAGYSAYGTSKGAVHLLTKQLACEWASMGIRVNCVAPCIFWTPLTEPILNDPKLYELFMTRIPMGRAAEPEDFIGAVLYLSSSASNMVTGLILDVDGGAVSG